jgi:hypothetical protein
MVLLTTCVYLLINFVYLSNNFERFDMFPRIRAQIRTPRQRARGVTMLCYVGTRTKFSTYTCILKYVVVRTYVQPEAEVYYTAVK